MKKICYIDKNIRFSEMLQNRLRAENFDLIYVNLGDKFEKPEQIEYFLVHGFVKETLLNQMSRCKYIGIRAHNTDYINKTIASSLGIEVQGLHNQYGINAVAEHTFALIFGLAKNLLLAHENVKSGKWRSGLNLNIELNGKKLGIIGHGKIGKRVAEIGRLLGMEILIAAKAEPKNEYELRLEAVLGNSDILVVLIPGTETNRNYINQQRIGQIKPGALFINTARGSVVDYQALEEALQSGALAGVGLDVFPEEPLVDHPICHHPSVICTPHVAFSTQEALDQMNVELMENFLEFCRKEV